MNAYEVAHIMDPVLDFPVPAAPRQHLARPGYVRTERSDAVYRFRRGLAGLEHGSFAHDAKGLAAARQRHEALVIVARSKHIAHPLLQPAVALVDGLATARAVPSKRLQILQHGGLVALDHQDVIGLPGNDQFCGFPATVQGVQGQPPPRHIQFVDQLAGGDDLAAGEATGGHLAADDTGAVLHDGNQATIRLARCACGAPAPTCRRWPVRSPARRFAPPNPAPPVPAPRGPDPTGCGAARTATADTAVRWSD